MDWSGCKAVHRNPAKQGGQLCLRGMRIPVASLFEVLALRKVPLSSSRLLREDLVRRKYASSTRVKRADDLERGVWRSLSYPAIASGACEW